jgi:hypothetical protein
MDTDFCDERQWALNTIEFHPALPLSIFLSELIPGPITGIENPLSEVDGQKSTNHRRSFTTIRTLFGL